MSRPSRPWFRFYTEALSDRKIRRLTPTQRWLWVACLGAARQSCIPGYLLVSERHPMNEEDVADVAAMPVKDVISGLAALAEAGLIEADTDLGCWSIPKWETRQYESDNSTLRTAKTRSKEQLKDVPNTVTTSFQGTPPDTEAETDTEPEKTLAAKPPRPADPIWDALAEEFGQPQTPTERSLFGKVAKGLKQANATPDQIRDRCAEHRNRWPNAECTPPSLEKHWTLLGRGPKQAVRLRPKSYSSLDEMKRMREEHEAARVGGDSEGSTRRLPASGDSG